MKELLLKGAEQMGVAMTAEQAQAFCEYHRMLVSANKTMNLTRISDDPAEAVDRNYLDSIAPLEISPAGGDKNAGGRGLRRGIPGHSPVHFCCRRFRSRSSIPWKNG